MTDIALLQHVKFVMKGGRVIKNELPTDPRWRSAPSARQSDTGR